LSTCCRRPLEILELQRRADEDRETRDRWYTETRAAIATLKQKIDQHASAAEVMRPAVAALELSRSKLAMWTRSDLPA
jgi:hypothetical protein